MPMFHVEQGGWSRASARRRRRSRCSAVPTFLVRDSSRRSRGGRRHVAIISPSGSACTNFRAGLVEYGAGPARRTRRASLSVGRITDREGARSPGLPLIALWLWTSRVGLGRPGRTRTQAGSTGCRGQACPLPMCGRWCLTTACPIPLCDIRSWSDDIGFAVSVAAPCARMTRSLASVFHVKPSRAPTRAGRRPRRSLASSGAAERAPKWLNSREQVLSGQPSVGDGGTCGCVNGT